MELGAHVARPMWKEGVGHTKPKRCCQIQEALPIVEGRLTMVEVMLAHHASRRLLAAAKLSIEITQHHHLINRGHNLQVTKQEQMKGVLDGSIRHIHGHIGHHHRHMLASNCLETS